MFIFLAMFILTLFGWLFRCRNRSDNLKIIISTTILLSTTFFNLFTIYFNFLFYYLFKPMGVRGTPLAIVRMAATPPIT
jgi:hypothetical protein